MGDHGQAKVGGHPPYLSESYTTQMLVVGKNIKEGVKYDYAEIIDIVPTIAWVHNVPLPKYSDGKILKEIKTGYKEPSDRDKLMENLNEALVTYHNKKNNERNDSFYTIDEIGIWHKSNAGSNYKRFVKNQVQLINQLYE